MDSTSENQTTDAYGGKVKPPQPTHGGDLGVEMSSTQPPAVATATLHYSQVPEGMRSVGQEPPVDALPPLPHQVGQSGVPQSTDQAPHLVYEPEAGMFVPDNSTTTEESPDAEAETYKATGERLLNQAVHKAEDILGEVKELAGSAFGELSAKASGAWHAMAGTIGAGPGKELAEDRSEKLVAGADREVRPVKSTSGEDMSHRGVDLGVEMSSYQPPVAAPAGIYPHGEIKKGDHRTSEVVGADGAHP
ncbi:hypothetical protein BV898_11789 [Hypsibius exemplaris]|uniref:Uncharacterized protein n=1 Tax=Hypsibius exemplaris TaxID=2072580 RepID=A0A1W0WFQ2_HYPEX|nr:hypothetical protein BV898_11789 [Hypsibius exemplaris]